MAAIIRTKGTGGLRRSSCQGKAGLNCFVLFIFGGQFLCITALAILELVGQAGPEPPEICLSLPPPLPSTNPGEFLSCRILLKNTGT